MLCTTSSDCQVAVKDLSYGQHRLIDRALTLGKQHRYDCLISLGGLPKLRAPAFKNLLISWNTSEVFWRTLAQLKNLLAEKIVLKLFLLAVLFTVSELLDVLNEVAK